MEQIKKHTSTIYSENLLAVDSSWNGHLAFMKYIVKLLVPKIFVELGTWKGSSYCSALQTIQSENLKTQAFAIDTWAGDIHMNYGSEVLKEFRKYHDPLYGHFSKLIVSDFDRAVHQFENNSIDLLHIDGTHTYQAVKNDFETWLPKLSDRAIVLFHDTNVKDEKNFGVWQFWEEIKEKYTTYFEFFHSAGLGVLVINPNTLNSELKEFFNSSNQEKEQIRALFSSVPIVPSFYKEYFDFVRSSFFLRFLFSIQKNGFFITLKKIIKKTFFCVY